MRRVGLVRKREVFPLIFLSWLQCFMLPVSVNCEDESLFRLTVIRKLIRY